MIFNTDLTPVLIIIGVLVLVIIIAGILIFKSGKTEEKQEIIIPNTRINKSHFQNNLKFLRIRNHINLEILSKDTNISIDRLVQFENDNATPNLYEIITLAKFFDLKTAEITYVDLIEKFISQTQKKNDF